MRSESTYYSHGCVRLRLPIYHERLITRLSLRGGITVFQPPTLLLVTLPIAAKEPLSMEDGVMMNEMYSPNLAFATAIMSASAFLAVQKPLINGLPMIIVL